MKILWISDSVNLYTGLGIQSYSILKHFAKSHEVLQLGWFCQQETEYNGIPIKPLGKNFGNIDEIKEYYYEFDPDIVISLGSISMVKKLTLFEDYVFKSKWIHWLPVVDEQDLQAEHLITLSDFGASKHKSKNIYLGVDKEIFRPLDNKNTLRVKEGLNDKFVCLMVAQNRWKETIPLMIQSFSKFSEDKKNADLIIHTKPWSASDIHSLNLREIIGKNHLGERIKISSESYTSIKMNRLYNCSNVLVSSSNEEGFGLSYVEAMMSGIPLLIPDYPISREHVLPDVDETKKCGELVNIISKQDKELGLFCEESISNEIRKCGELVNVTSQQIDTDDFAEKLQKFYEDWIHGERLLKRYGRTGRQIAIRKYDIDKTARDWDALINDVSSWQKLHILQSPKIPVILKEIL